MKLYKNKEWLENKINEVGNLTEIGKICGVSGDTIEYWRRKHNISKHIVKRKKYSVNESFFDIIDTEEKAYWLGFIMADGCICTSNSSSPNNRLSIILNQKDKDHLIKFKKAIDSKAPVREGTVIDKRGFVTYKAEFRVNSLKMCSTLISLDVKPRKTGKEIIPSQIPTNLIRHFCRGFFDGDGSIAKSSNHNYYRFKLGSASETIIKQFQDLFINEGIGKVNYYIEKQYNKPFYILESNSKYKANAIFHWLYDDVKVFLDRKFLRAKDMFLVCAPEQ